VQSQVLKQYFMLTFTYKIKNYKGSKAPAEPEERERNMMRRPDGMFGRPPGGGGGAPGMDPGGRGGPGMP
jgi:hypothetical protein